MPQHAPPHERQRDVLGEEDTPDAGGYVGESIAHAADDKVLEDGCVTGELGLLGFGGEVAVPDEADGKLDHCRKEEQGVRMNVGEAYRCRNRAHMYIYS